MPPVLGPVSPSPTRLWSCAEASATARVAVDQGEQAGFLALEEFLDHHRPVAGRADRGLGFGAGHRDGDALAGGKAVGLDHHRDREAVERGARLGLGLDADISARSGCRARAHRSLVKPFEPSSWAAAAFGPNTANPAARRRRRRRRPAALRGRSTTRSIARASARATTASASHGIDRDAVGPARDARIAGRGNSSPQLGDCLSRQASASSRPPEPSSRTFMTLPDDDDAAGLLADRSRRQFAAADRQRTVGRAEAHGRERVRPCPGARRDFGLQAPRLGPLLFHAEGRRRVHRRGDLAGAGGRRSPSRPRTAPRSSPPAS